MHAQKWLTDFSEAKKIALEKNRNIILVFAGSDWCAPCIKLEKKIWDSDIFKNYANDHFVLLKADFPRKKKNQLSKKLQESNNKLAERYNRNGHFPLIIVINSEGKPLGTTGYKKLTPQGYIDLLTSFEK